MIMMLTACFPQQDRHPVLSSQDISPTAPTTNNTPPSLTESSTTDTPATENCDNKSYNNIENRPDDDDDDDDYVDCFP
jgi:hypothetical protein